MLGEVCGAGKKISRWLKEIWAVRAEAGVCQMPEGAFSQGGGGGSRHQRKTQLVLLKPSDHRREKRRDGVEPPNAGERFRRQPAGMFKVGELGESGREISSL